MSNSTLPILLVEDNADNRQLVTWILEDADFQVAEAENAEQGLAMLEDNRYALILMDITLPGIDGKEATRIIRQNQTYGDTPIIALTAHIVAEEKQNIMASGVDALLNKPVEEEDLLATMSTLMK
ncbi:response regulator [Agarilytica rhodophyticola]|uniref:response regulator n=1 Tax=Agarilytica rhodophyticola TaxID=1737490 RepID=UPI000B347582|nr:response regulator [Agarilytica rhodophyticola]